MRVFTFVETEEAYKDSFEEFEQNTFM